MRTIAAVLVSVVLLAGCGQSSVTVGEARLDTSGETVVDFFQDGENVGQLFVLAQPARNGFVALLIEMPYMGEDYRLDSLTFEFLSDAIQPLIMLEPANDVLTQDITFSRVDSSVLLVVPDTGRAGDGTVLFKLLAGVDVLTEQGIRLYA